MMANRAYSTDEFDTLPLTRKTLQDGINVIIKSYFVDEGVSKGVRLLNSLTATQEITNLMSLIAQDGVSIIAIEKKTNNVVGVAFNKLQVQVESGRTFMEEYGDKCTHPSSKMWVKIMNDIATANDAFEKYRTNCLLEIVCAAVLPEFRGNGIGKKLIKDSVEVGRSLNSERNVKQALNSEQLPLEPIPHAVVAVTTASATQHITATMGFETAVAVKYSSFAYEGVSFDNVVSADLDYIKLMCIGL